MTVKRSSELFSVVIYYVYTYNLSGFKIYNLFVYVLAAYREREGNCQFDRKIRDTLLGEHSGGGFNTGLTAEHIY